MSSRAVIFVTVALSFSTVSACARSGGESGAGTDGGSTGDTSPPGSPNGRDSGTIITIPVDAGRRPVNQLPEGCEPTRLMELPANGLPRCAAATLRSLQSCGTTDNMCFSNALENDPTPAFMGVNCSSCIQVQQIACAYTNGCSTQFDTFECCISDACPTNDRACIQAAGGTGGACAAASAAFETCLEDSARGCNASVLACFAMN